ncbi:MAG: EAL domain-containing protein [Betaproteobacteria bacterium]
MPLTDLVLNLNKIDSPPETWAQTPSQFIAGQGQVFVHFANLRLESLFVPIVETASGKVYGHAASLRAYNFSTWQPVRHEAVFVLPSDNEEFVYLDRMVRTLHALNYLTHQLRGNLLLKVHPRHVASVPAHHGLAFEEILRSCGLAPEQITLELRIDGVEDPEHLKRAVDNYRSRGYGIAIHRLGTSPVNLGLLTELRPDVVKLDATLMATTQPLQRLIDQLHEAGARVMIEGSDNKTLCRGAAALDIDLLQSHPTTHRPLALTQPPVRRVHRASPVEMRI